MYLFVGRLHPFSRDWDDRLANGCPTDPIHDDELESPSRHRGLAAVILSAIRQLAAVYLLAFGLVAAFVVLHAFGGEGGMNFPGDSLFFLHLGGVIWKKKKKKKKKKNSLLYSHPDATS
jgi:hypothetical protein